MTDLTRKTAKEKTVEEILADPSALADADGPGLVSGEVSETIAADAQLIGDLFVTKVGKAVTITSDGALTHSTASFRETNSGWLPERYRPSATISVTFDTYSGGTGRVDIEADGTLSVNYRNWSGSARNATTTRTGFTISYVVD